MTRKSAPVDVLISDTTASIQFSPDENTVKLYTFESIYIPISTICNHGKH